MLDNKYASIALVAVVSNVPASANAGEIDYSKSFDLAGISKINEYSGDIIVGDSGGSSGPTSDEKCIALGFSQTTCDGDNCNVIATCQYDSSYVKCGCYCNTAETCEEAGYVHIDDFVPCVDIAPCQEVEVQCPYNDDYYSCNCHCDVESFCNVEGYTETSCLPEQIASDCPYDDTYKKCI